MFESGFSTCKETYFYLVPFDIFITPFPVTFSLLVFLRQKVFTAWELSVLSLHSLPPVPSLAIYFVKPTTSHGSPLVITDFFFLFNLTR